MKRVTFVTRRCKHIVDADAIVAVREPIPKDATGSDVLLLGGHTINVEEDAATVAAMVREARKYPLDKPETLKDPEA